MDILCCCHQLKLLTGSEVYFYELCDALQQLGHNVEMYTPNLSTTFKAKCKIHNSKETLNNQTFDLIIMSHYESLKDILNHYVDTPKINIIHSEIYDLEKPYIHNSVIKYIGIRKPICEKLINEYDVSPSKIELIRNPIDLSRFNTENTSDEGYGLFVGTMGGLRIKAAYHFAVNCKINNLKSIYISAENTPLNFFDVSLGSQNDIENYFKKCSVSGGIIEGRTYFEAKLCGKKVIEYYVNEFGHMKDIKYEDKPSHEELISLQNEFSKLEVAKKIIS